MYLPHISIYVLFGCIVNKYINNGIRGVTPRVAPNIVVAMLLAMGGFGANLDCMFTFQRLLQVVFSLGL